MYSVENIDGPLAFWTSLFPPDLSHRMMVRIPLWRALVAGIAERRLALRHGLLHGLAGGKIYRVGILMYGKKPSMKEIIKWMRYK